VPPLPLPSGLAVYLVKPNYGLSTPKVFKAMDLSKLSPQPPEELLEAFQQHGVDHDCWVNDLERPAFEVCPELGELKAFLQGEEFGFQAVLMSGSGTTIFCLGEPKGSAEVFEAEVRKKFDIEGIWRTQLVGRTGPNEWYSAPAEGS